MSADNYLLVRPHQGKWAVTMEFASCDVAPVGPGDPVFATKDEARDYAFEVERTQMVEYGVSETGEDSEHERRYFLDCEFMEDGRAIELLSIGMVCEDGREFYAENVDADYEHANEWVRENVLPHLWSRQADKRDANLWSRDGGAGGLMPRESIARALKLFVAAGEGKPEFWAYYGDYDWVVLCQLFGRMVDLPEGWPMFALDVKQLAVSLGNPALPKQTSIEHNALTDARWTRDAWAFLRREHMT